MSAFFSYFRFSPNKTGSHDWIILKKDVTLEIEIGKRKETDLFVGVFLTHIVYQMVKIQPALAT